MDKPTQDKKKPNRMISLNLKIEHSQ
jgi:hypothetical protein